MRQTDSFSWLLSELLGRRSLPLFPSGRGHIIFVGIKLALFVLGLFITFVMTVQRRVAPAVTASGHPRIDWGYRIHPPSHLVCWRNNENCKDWRQDMIFKDWNWLGKKKDGAAKTHANRGGMWLVVGGFWPLFSQRCKGMPRCRSVHWHKC